MLKTRRLIAVVLAFAILLPAAAWAVEVIVGDRVANDDIPFCGG